MDSGVTKIIQTIVENWALLSTAVGGAVGGTYWLTNKFTDGQEKNLKSRIELLTEEKRILIAKLAQPAAGMLEKTDVDSIDSRSTMRAGVSLGQAINSSGLVDIEWRDKAATVAPPSSFYEIANTEVCIFGLSCRHSVFLESDLLKQLLRKPVDLHLVFLAPNSAGAAEAGRLLGFDLAAEITSVVNHDNFKELQKFTNFYAWTLEEDIP